MPAKVAALLQAAAALTPEELEDFYARLSALRVITGLRGEIQCKGNAAKLDSGDWAARALYTAVTEGLLRAFKRQPAPWIGFKHSPHYHKFRATVQKVLEQHEQLCPGQDKPRKISMLMLYGRLAVDFIMEGRSAGHFQHAVFRDTINSLEDLALLVDYHFPGYAASGLLRKVAELRTSPAPRKAV